jgi:hypothetical protein
LERLFAAHGATFEESTKKEYAERLQEAKGEAWKPKQLQGR